MAIGNCLKFSPTKSWEPDRSWGTFSKPLQGIQLRENRVLIHSRTCWNKMFRRRFWESSGIAFPHAERSNDIAPMIHAYTMAKSMDVLPDIVYIYRQRPGNGSMTARAHRPSSLVSYLEQETHCLELLREHGDPGTLNEFYFMFLTADGWNHLSRFLAAPHDEESEDMRRAYPLVKALIREAPQEIWDNLAPEQRHTFTLFSEGHPFLVDQ